MAIQSGFFDSISQDRVYFSLFFAQFLGAINGNGITNTTSDFNFSSTGTDMVSTIGAGQGIIEGRFIVSDSNFNVTHSNADPTNDRIDRIVLRMSLDQAARSIVIAISEGTPAATPAPPALTRTDDLYELSLYQVRVPAASSIIPQGNQTDERADRTLCGQVFYRGFLQEVIAEANTILINGLRSDVGTLSNLQTTAQNNLVAAINEVDTNTNNNAGSVGVLTSLTTTARNNLVAAVNEVDSNTDTNTGNITTNTTNIATNTTDISANCSSITTNATNISSNAAAITGNTNSINTNSTRIGNLPSLTTTNKSNLVVAVNEVDGNTNTNAGNISTSLSRIGTLSSLTTTAKSNLVAAVNEVDGNTNTNASNISTSLSRIGTLSSLTTTAKTNLVVAVNEVDGNTNTNASGISTNSGNIGTLSSLTTTAKGNLVAAINEVDGNIDPFWELIQRVELTSSVSSVSTNIDSSTYALLKVVSRNFRVRSSSNNRRAFLVRMTSTSSRHNYITWNLSSDLIDRDVSRDDFRFEELIDDRDRTTPLFFTFEVNTEGGFCTGYAGDDEDRTMGFFMFGQTLASPSFFRVATESGNIFGGSVIEFWGKRPRT